jgi:hypothetical protein
MVRNIFHLGLCLGAVYMRWADRLNEFLSCLTTASRRSYNEVDRNILFRLGAVSMKDY